MRPYILLFAAFFSIAGCDAKRPTENAPSLPNARADVGEVGPTGPSQAERDASARREEARQALDQVLQNGTLEAFEDFLQSYPDSESAAVISKKAQLLSWQRADSDAGYRSLARHLQRHFCSEYWQEALERLVQMAESKRTALLESLPGKGEGRGRDDIAELQPQDVILIPASRELLEIQELLLPGHLAEASPLDTLVVYGYSKGSSLGYSVVSGAPALSAQGQGLNCFLHIYLDSQWVAGRESSGGEEDGSFGGIWHKATGSLGLGPELLLLVRTILSAAMGSRRDQISPFISEPQDCRLYTAWIRTMQISPNWSDRANAAYHLSKGPLLKPGAFELYRADALDALMQGMSDPGEEQARISAMDTLVTLAEKGHLKDLPAKKLSQRFRQLVDVVERKGDMDWCFGALLRWCRTPLFERLEDAERKGVIRSITAMVKREREGFAYISPSAYFLSALLEHAPVESPYLGLAEEVFGLYARNLKTDFLPTCTNLSGIANPALFKAQREELRREIVDVLLIPMDNLYPDDLTPMDEQIGEIMRSCARQALKALSGEDFGESAEAWQQGLGLE